MRFRLIVVAPWCCLLVFFLVFTVYLILGDFDCCMFVVWLFVVLPVLLDCLCVYCVAGCTFLFWFVCAVT